MAKLTVIVLALYFALISAKPYDDQTSEINYINSIQNSWKAGYSKIGSLDKQEFRKLLGATIPSNLQELKRKHVRISNDIPATFDAREQWPECTSISSIKVQGKQCAGCWAVAGASVASDRLCIGSNLKIKKNLSAENLMTCCADCAPDGGCNGGNALKGWQYMQDTGIVTGGDFESNEGCQPYYFGPDSLNLKNYFTPSCDLKCTNSEYQTPYEEDLTKADSFYLLNTNVEEIETDILKHGPVEATFAVYDDFQHYKSGVYVRTTNETDDSYHSVRIIGWGYDEESQLDYWLAANSWGTDWGLEGLFKIIKGHNECKIEDFCTGGLLTGKQ